MKKEIIFRFLTLPRLLVFGAFFCFLVDFSLNLSQLSHLKKYQEKDFSSLREYAYLNLAKDNVRLQLVQLCVTLFFAILCFLLINFIWEKTNGNFLFLLVITVIEFFFTKLPFEIIKSNVIYPKYDVNEPFDRKAFGQLLMETAAMVLLESLVIIILNLFGKCTHIERLPDENPEDMQTVLNQNNNNNNENPLIQDNNALTPDQETREEDPNNHNRKCCRMFRLPFWAVIPIILIPAFFFITAYLPDILMLEGEGVYSPISTEDTNKAIYNLSKKVGFPYEEIYISFSQRDENSPNAYFSGIISKKVMVTNTLMRIVDIQQVSAVVGHELGHYKHNDILFSFFMQSFLICLFSFCVFIVQKKTLSDFGLGYQMPVVVVIFVASGLCKPLYSIYQPLQNTIMRTFEKNADCFAAEMGLPIGKALQSLFDSVGQSYESSTAYSNYYDNHPRLSERLEHIKQCTPTNS